jgi:gluconolactonase
MSAFEVLATDVGFAEGPVWTRDGRLLITSVSHGKVYEISNGSTRTVAETAGGPNGMVESADGSLYVAQNGGGFGTGREVAEKAMPGIQRVSNGSVSYLAGGLDAPNDLCFGPDGRLYFTDPRGWATPENAKPGRVYALDVNGGEPELLVEGPRFTNGIAFDRQGGLLYLGATFEQRVLAYPMSRGALGEAREFCRTEPGFPDGMCFDEAGKLYVAATMAQEVQVFDGSGNRTEQLSCGGNSMPTNCCFGGPANKTLFVTDARNERVLAIEREVAGLPLFPFR